MERFSDFAADDEKAFSGDKAKINDILNKEIIILRYKVTPSKYKDKGDKCATVQFKEGEEGTEKIFFTGSEVIMNQLEKYKEKLPFICTLKKVDMYYTLA